MEAVTLNPDRRIHIRTVGMERTPVIVIDDVVASPRKLVDHAIHRAVFSEEKRQAYPGARAPLPGAYASALLPFLIQLLGEVYAHLAGRRFRVIHQLFSLVTRPPRDLALLQRMPHFDSHFPFYFATVHYLNPGEFAGTGFFRHRPTGFETVSESRRSAFVRAAKRHVEDCGEPAQDYIAASDNHFKLVEELEYRCNRLILYPGYLLHSGLIKPNRDIGSDPARDRLTANLFFMPA